ncbi:MAG: hypothetical protein FWH36_04890 [Lentimicrobiaceae bacterium]|nr:hypothetical protein [Lentimicrobiaceae bacterium]
MRKYIDYQTFTDLQEAAHLIETLNANQIPFKIDASSTTSFDVLPQNINPMTDGVVVKIRLADKKKADKICLENAENNSAENHYLFSFSDNDIIDVIVNPEEWTEEEVALAKKISKQRDLKPTAEQVKNLRKNTDKLKEQVKKENRLQGHTAWFLCISILSIVNSILIISQQTVHFPIGLGINEILLGIMSGIQKITGTDLMGISFFLSLLMPALFFWIWLKSKEKNKNVYLAGIIIYGADALFMLWCKYWIGTAFHAFVLLGLCAGYRTLIADKKNSELEGGSLPAEQPL